MGGAAELIRLRAGLTYGYVTGDKTYSLDQLVPYSKALDFKLNIQLVTLVAGLDLAGGRGVGLVFPTARIYSNSEAGGEHIDYSRGDAEVRFRQDLMSLLSLGGPRTPRVVLSLGGVLPTGHYVGKATVVSGAAPVAPQAVDTTYSSLGRGVFWLLADLESFGRITDDLAYYGGLWTRFPLGETSNQFIWGAEQRISMGFTYRIVPKLLSAALMVDWQRRLKASEVLGDKPRSEFLNGGGDWIDLSPSLRFEINPSLSLTASVRQPLYRNVVGLQGIMNTGYFIGIQYGQVLSGGKPTEPVFTVGAAAQTPEMEKLVVAGKTTVIDYWATWCEPCKKLGAELDEYLKDRADVVLQRVNATEWLQPEMDRFLPGCPGIPVLDIFSPDKKLVIRLVGPDTLQYRKYLAAPPPQP